MGRTLLQNGRKRKEEGQSRKGLVRIWAGTNYLAVIYTITSFGKKLKEIIVIPEKVRLNFAFKS